jgi:uncharacterized protein with ParB-like and HNH nuclease domain
MKADSLKISRVFLGGGDVLYLLPHFQREYSWEKENWQTLFSDVQAIYESYNPDQEPEHFMGTLVVINDGTRNGTISAFKLVDGQQRLTTISLLLCALYRLCRESHPETAKKIQKLLTNPDEQGDYFFKLLPTTKYGDRAAYTSILRGDEAAPNTESRIPEAFNFLFEQLKDRLNAGEIDPNRYFVALTNCLQVVFINLDQKERPYEIFESLNAKAKPLSPADLVRNYIAMRLPETKQEEIFNKYWTKIDDLLQEKRTVGKSRLGELTAFLRHYLAMLTGTLPNERHVYERFRDRMEREFKEHADFVGELAILHRFANYYDHLLRPDNEPDKAIREQLKRLNTLEVSTAYPFLLQMYDAWKQEALSRADMLVGLQIIENYLVRRYLTGEQTNYLNKMFPTLWPQLDPNQFTSSLQQALLSRNYPSDSRIRQFIYTEGLYKGNQVKEKTALILETINRHLSKGSGAITMLDGSSTIEHIMPQTLSDAWKKHLGADWEKVYREYLNTLGNLTLVTQEWNTAMSNETFEKKRAILAHHGLRLNSDYFSLASARWNEAAIKKRADFLAEQILEIWPAFGEPPLSAVGKSTTPKVLTILGERHRVESWRDVAGITAETVIEFGDDFVKIVEQLPNYFFKEETRYTHRQLSNGWWLYTNLSGSATKSLCHQLIAAAGIPEEEWIIEEE